MGKLDHQHLPTEVQKAGTHLSRAREFALDVQLDIWQFAEPLPNLVDMGVTEPTLRWLVLKGYAEHAHELTTFRDVDRQFRPSLNLSFTPETCFVLSEAGALLVGSWSKESALPPGRPSNPAEIVSFCSQLPHWDGNRRVLYFGGQVVKRYRFQAANQAAILAAFQEENWPYGIHDPLPQVSGLPPKRRLNETIKSLNANQECPLLRFRGDGTGEHICWEPPKPAY